MRYSILSCVLVLVSCGGQPQIQTAPAPTRTLSSLATTFSPTKVGPSIKTYTIFHSEALPPMTQVESVLAKRSIIADAGEGTDGLEIALEGVLCALSENSSPNERPRPAMHDALQANGLSETEATAMGEATKALKIVCTADREMPPRSLPPLAEAAVEVIAELSKGWINDHDTSRFWPKTDWATARKAKTKYDPERASPIVQLKMSGGQVWLGTVGMAAFGRPDVALFPVAPAMVGAASKELRAISDLLLDEKQVGPGMKAPMGAVDMMMVDHDAYARTLNTSATGVPPASTYGRLAAVDPNAPVGDTAAHASFVRRLTIR